MDARLGWVLAALLLGAGWQQYGWQGVLTAVTAIVFWLLLQFNRVMKTMRVAGASPVGRVPSAVMFNARLKAGLKMIDVVTMTRSLGERVSESPEVWQWTDDGDSRVLLTFERARLVKWALQRPEAQAEVQG